MTLPAAAPGRTVYAVSDKRCWANLTDDPYSGQCTTNVDPHDDLGLCPAHIAHFRELDTEGNDVV